MRRDVAAAETVVAPFCVPLLLWSAFGLAAALGCERAAVSKFLYVMASGVA